MLLRVRDHAARSRSAHEWLLESARQWARREFVRRARERALNDRDVLRLDEDVRRLARHQVAVLTRGRIGVGPEQVEATGILCGFLGEGVNADYVVIYRVSGEKLAGMIGVTDIVELHPNFRLAAWPWPVD